MPLCALPSAPDPSDLLPFETVQVVGSTPYEGSTSAATVKRISCGYVRYPQRLSAPAAAFLRAALTWNKEARPCLADLQEHKSQVDQAACA